MIARYGSFKMERSKIDRINNEIRKNPPITRDIQFDRIILFVRLNLIYVALSIRLQIIS